jgi:hypothetical protein
VIATAAIGASITIAVRGGEAVEAADAGVVHAARHDDTSAAERVARELYPDRAVAARRVGDSFVVTVTDAVSVAHPESRGSVDIAVSSVMPLAPFRSDRG